MLTAPLSRRFARLVTLALVTGCADGTAPAPIEGQYELRTVNGSPLPYTHTYSATASYTVRSQRVTILTGASWSSATSHVYVYPGLVRDETNAVDAGSFTYGESTGSLLLRSGGTSLTYPGNVSGRTLTMYRDGDKYLYER